jgi:uncharacterized protein YjbI with pentapeptide repeats
MREKADLREANLNGAILADAKLGGACLDEGFCCATYTALRVTSSPTRTLHRHTETTFDPDRCHGATGAYRLPSGPRHPYGFDADIADKLETIHRDANFGAPSQRGFLKVKD